MQFIYHKNAKNEHISLGSEKFKHLIKVHRKKIGDFLHVRNLQDANIYLYKIDEIQKNDAILSLVSYEKNEKQISCLTLAWAIIDPKVIEKTLPMLNEIGVREINFVYTDFSQKNFKLDFERLNKILISSCEQCGRSSLLKMNLYQNLQMLLDDFPDCKILDFGGKSINKNMQNDCILVGCEGGFSDKEKKIFGKRQAVGFECDFILKSQTAICALSAKILL